MISTSKDAKMIEEMAALKAENERLRQELTEARDIAEDFMRKDLDSSLVARQENERLRSALAIYAYHGNWNSTREGWFDEWMESGSDGFTYDGTAIARAALDPK